MVVNLSLSIRVAVNAEALNMAEAVGNYTRHRKAPVVISTGSGYSVVYVPAVSGESLAHNYQVLLTQIAKSRGLPVTKMDELGYFLKFSDNNVIQGLYKEDLEKIFNDIKAKAKERESLSQSSDLSGCFHYLLTKKDAKKEVTLEELLRPSDEEEGSSKEENPRKSKRKSKEKAEPKSLRLRLSCIEELLLKASVVADVGGFLYTNGSIKRTSAVRFSYMLPALDSIEKGGAAIIPQLHARYSPPEYAKDIQKLFYIESGSALYTFTAELRASDIGVLNYSYEGSRLLENWKERVKMSVEALMALVDGMMFGAKRSRYDPLWDVKSMVVAVSSGPVEFVVSPGLTRDYIKKTYERALWLTKSIDGETVSIYVFDSEGLEKPPRQSQEQSQKTEEKVTFDEASSHTEALFKAGNKLYELLKLKEDQQPKGQ